MEVCQTAGCPWLLRLFKQSHSFKVDGLGFKDFGFRDKGCRAYGLGRTKARFCGRASVCGLTHPKATTYNSQGIRLYMFLRTSKAALRRSLARLVRISGPYQGTRAGPCPCGRAPQRPGCGKNRPAQSGSRVAAEAEVV